MYPDVSIIIPVYNEQKHLERCVRSVLNQTHVNIEVIIVDDGSIDNSGKIAQDMHASDKRVTVIHQINSGVAKARNTGIRASRGTFICLLDADDWVEADMIEAMLKVKESSSKELIIGGFFLDFNDGKTSENTMNLWQDKEAPINQIKYLRDRAVAQEILLSSCGKLYRRDVIIDNQLSYHTDIPIFEDYLFNLEFLTYVKEVAFMNKCYYHYSILEGSSTHKYRSKHFLILSKVYNIKSNIIEKWKKDSSDYRIAAATCFFKDLIQFCIIQEFAYRNGKSIVHKLRSIRSIVNSYIVNELLKEPLKLQGRYYKLMYKMMKRRSVLFTALGAWYGALKMKHSSS